jgi:membrane protein implicated in regulation of membrane protease activity
MKNPFKSEADAFRLVIGAVVYFGAIAIAVAVGGRWWGLAVFVVLSAAVGIWIFRREVRERPTIAPRRRGAEDERRILVVANETVAGAALRDEIRRAVEDHRANVLVVSPALNSKLKHWTNDEDQARAAAEKRLGRSIAQLEQLGISARGEVGDADPLQAIEDALRTFGPDLIVISTHPEGRSNWLEHGVVSSARERFAVPITHVVVDLQAEAVQAEPV